MLYRHTTDPIVTFNATENPDFLKNKMVKFAITSMHGDALSLLTYESLTVGKCYFGNENSEFINPRNVENLLVNGTLSLEFEVSCST